MRINNQYLSIFFLTFLDNFLVNIYQIIRNSKYIFALNVLQKKVMICNQMVSMLLRVLARCFYEINCMNSNILMGNLIRPVQKEIFKPIHMFHVWISSLMFDHKQLSARAIFVLMLMYILCLSLNGDLHWTHTNTYLRKHMLIHSQLL